jgi:hypothetical protein
MVGSVDASEAVMGREVWMMAMSLVVKSLSSSSQLPRVVIIAVVITFTLRGEGGGCIHSINKPQLIIIFNIKP